VAEVVSFVIDGVTIEASAGQTVLEACDAAGIYIPRL
jgi:[NiFe] hydrogenase diaphorase moiety small subunit